MALYDAASGAFALSAIVMHLKSKAALYVLIFMAVQINEEGPYGGISLKTIFMEQIRVGDVVYHKLSKLLFMCENNKHMRWMNMNPYYTKTNLKKIDYEQFEKSTCNKR